MTLTHLEIREAVIATAREMEERDLTIGTSGNVSHRVPEGALITPSTMPYRAITPADTIVMDLEGTVIRTEGENATTPSVEHQVHLACYRARSEVNAVIHAHPTFASAFAAARRTLPAFLDEVGVYVGEEVRCADYAISGTPDIAANVVAAMGETANAVFLASHGLVAVGRDLASALMVARHVERAAQVYLWTTLLGGPVDLPDEATALFAQVFEYFKTS